MAENNKYIDSRIENIWRFIRGDMKVQDFEQWVYSENTLEKMLGKTLYLETISVNYFDKDALRQDQRTSIRICAPNVTSSVQMYSVVRYDSGGYGRRK